MYEKGSNEKILIKFDYDFSIFKLKSIEVGGELISTGYTFYEGSVILELDNTILETLSIGVHNVKIELEAGQIMNATLEVIEPKVTEAIVNPETNDNIVFYNIAALISIIGIASIVAIKAKIK